MKTQSKAYTKMYLVTPGVYDKMLKCLDQSDVKSTEKLNEPESIVEKPSSTVLQQIVEEDIAPPEEEAELIPQVVEEQIQPFEETIDLPVQPEVEAQIQPELMPEQSTSTKPCGRKDDGNIIPQENLIYNPGVQKPRIIQPQIKRLGPPGERVGVKGFKGVTIANKKGPKLECPVCKKHFRGKWQLDRHTKSVHSNLNVQPYLRVTKKQPEQVVQQQVKPLPDDASEMTESVKEETPMEFSGWGNNQPRQIRKRNLDKQLQRPSKYRPDDEYFESYTRSGGRKKQV